MSDRRRAYMFFAVNILFHMAASFAHPVTPTIIKDRGFGDYVFGVALAAMLTTNFLFSPFWGRLISSLSSRRVMLICGLGYAAGQAMFGLAQTEAALIGARMFAGLFTCGVFTAFLTYVVNTSSDELRGSYLAISATIGMVASAFGFFTGGMLGEINVNIALIAQVIVLGGCGIIFYFVCVDDATVSIRDVRASTLLREANPVASFLAGRSLMAPLFVALLAICSLANLGGTAFDQSFNYYMKAQLGLSSGYNGAVKGVVGLVSLIANSTVGLWLINKTDIRRSVIYVYLLCSFAILGVVLLNSVVPLVAVNILYFAIFAISIPLTQNLVAQRARQGDSNLIMGYYNGVRSLGGIVGALSAGLLYAIGPKLPFVLALAAFVLATAAATYYYRRSLAAEATETA